MDHGARSEGRIEKGCEVSGDQPGQLAVREGQAGSCGPSGSGFGIERSREVAIMSRLFACVVFALIATLQVAEAEESRSPMVQEIIIRGKFIAPFAGAIAARYLPVVSIAIVYDPQYAPGRAISTNSVRTELIGLVDSGSDGLVIDKGVAEAIGMKRLPPREVFHTGNKISNNIYQGQLVLTDVGYVLSGEFAGAPLRETGASFDAILGMELLRRFDVRINRKENTVLLRYIGE
jgi:predicted aspartyl protease